MHSVLALIHFTSRVYYVCVGRGDCVFVCCERQQERRGEKEVAREKMRETAGMGEMQAPNAKTLFADFERAYDLEDCFYDHRSWRCNTVIACRTLS